MQTDLQYNQNLLLPEKVLLTRARIHDFYRKSNGKVFISFSGGKDSLVVLNEVRKLYPEVPCVFVDTGFEYPEIRDFVRTIPNVIWLKPKLTFKAIIEEYGYPVISKQQSRNLSDVQNATTRNQHTVRLRLTGLTKNGVKIKDSSLKIPKKWLYLTSSNIKFSDKCCFYLKKHPIFEYQKQTGRVPFIGTMACESIARKRAISRTGCNVYSSQLKETKSQPISFWFNEDVWAYIKMNNLEYSKIYDLGEKRTGCMFCMFGAHLEEEPNRFQRMKKSHPKQYKFCMDKLGLSNVLKLLKIKYE